MDLRKSIGEEIKDVLKTYQPNNTVKGFMDYTNELRIIGILKEETFDLREIHKTRDFSFVLDRTSKNSVLNKA